MPIELSLADRALLNEAVLHQELNGESVLLDLNSGTYYGLDAVGTRIWQLLSAAPILSEVVDTVVSEYDVTEAQFAQDLLALVSDLQQHGLVTLTRPDT